MNDILSDLVDEFEFDVPPESVGWRVDKFLAHVMPSLSRSRLQALIDDGMGLVNGQSISSSYKLKQGDLVSIHVPPAEDATPQPEDIPLDILFEDDDVIVINKPIGMVVHPAVGHYTGTLVNALLHHCGDTLSGINGVKRPGIVHRLDKDTSGAMMVAKNDFAHHALSAQLQDRSLFRLYHAITVGMPVPIAGTIDAPVGRHAQNRLKMAVTSRHGREAVTHYNQLEHFHNEFSLVECRLATGRTHQIRVHFEHIHYPLLGDPLYGAPQTKIRAALKRAGYDEDNIDFITSYPYQALHAHQISFIHPRTGEVMAFTAPYAPSFKELCTRLAAI